MTKDHHDDPSGASRRSFLKGVGLAAGAASLPLAVPPAGASDVPGDLPDGLKYYPARAQEITLEINGKQEKLTVEPRTSLLSALREHLGLTGAKEVCDRGSCGCCTVQLDGVSVCSCLMMAMEAEGASITTIEGLAADEANTEMIDHLCSHDAAQCGFCIPGFVVRGEEVLREADGALDDQAIREGLSGNICRCGTYYKLFDGFKAASGGEVNRILANNVTLEDERPRADVREKLTGSAKYTADMFPEKIIYARFIRFPHGAGKVASIDAEAARKIPGVLKVHLDEDKKEARYTSERLGYIVAVSREIISDAMIALKMRVKLDREIATNPDDYYSGPPETNSEDSQQLAALYNKAAAVVESEYRTQVQTHSSLETHGSLVDYKGDSADVWASTQGTFSVANEIGEPMGLETSQVTVNCEFIGGGFGSKFGVNPEDALAARLSKEFGRPCKVMLDRKEEHTDAGNRPGSIQYMKIAADEKGKILGGRIHVASTVGYRKGGGGAKNPRWYDFGDVVRTEEEILLAAGTPRAFRAPGHPQGCFAVESMIDELAGKLGLDPMDVRLLNEESDRRRKQYKQGAAMIGWHERKPDGSDSGRIKRGIGMGGADWPRWPTRCQAQVDIYPDGKIEVLTGTQDIGTGNRTVAIDVCADQLGVDRELITGKVGNSKYPPGPASGGSVTARSLAPAVRDAADDAKAQLFERVAKLWKCKPEELTIKDGVVRREESMRTMTWSDACTLLGPDKISGSGRIKDEYLGEGTSDAAQFAQVAVDTETGQVKVEKIVAIQACGQVVNRLMAENQIYGGVIQGISYALLEDRLLDGPTGGMLNPNMEQYKIAGPLEVPEIIAVLDADESDTGVRAIGEPVTIPTAAAIANAVANALGVRIRSLPITPERVLEALKAKGASA